MNFEGSIAPLFIFDGEREKMATTTKTKTAATKSKTAAKPKTAAAKSIKEAASPVVETPAVTVTPEANTASVEVAPAPKKFNADDMVTCRSVRNGVMQYVGRKTGDLYELNLFSLM